MQSFSQGALAFLAVASSIMAAGDATLLKIGSVAPDFTLENQDGVATHLADYKGKSNVVLVFYPGDQTPGCTSQLCALRDDKKLFEDKNAVIFGINPANKKSHTAFIKNQNLTMPLLVDSILTVTKLYGCNGFPIVRRTVYVVGLDGTIIFAARGTPSNSAILAALP